MGRRFQRLTAAPEQEAGNEHPVRHFVRLVTHLDLPKQEDRGIAALGDRDLRNLLVNRRRATAPARPARSGRAPPGLIKAMTCCSTPATLRCVRRPSGCLQRWSGPVFLLSWSTGKPVSCKQRPR